MHYRWLVLTFVILLSPFGERTTSYGEQFEQLAARHYGRGVHAFHQGRYSEALRDLDTAANYVGTDPRTYYMRGLAKLHMGSRNEAEGDFSYAATLETTLHRRDVGVALQRIQGSDRLLIERYRSQARQMAAAAAETNDPPKPAANAPTNPEDPIKNVPPASRARTPRRSVGQTGNLKPDASDPFADSASGFLGRGDLEPSTPATQAPATDSEEAAAEANSDANDDPFADDDANSKADDAIGSGVKSNETEAASPTGSSATGSGNNASGKKSGGAIGAALRAMSRGLMPADAITNQGRKLLQQGIPGIAPPSAGSDGGQAADDGGSADAPADGTKPPADDPFADESADGATTPDAPATTDADEDPFGQ